jgi:NADH-quinone oxidoreductase subunit D
MEEATGGRIHPVANRVGGLHEDVPAGWSRRVRAAVGAARAELELLDAVVASDRFVERTSGRGVLDPAVAVAYGVTGAPARASGVDMDLRRDDPCLAYPELDVRVVTRTAGDALARFQVLAEQLRVAADLVDACLDRLPDGPVALPLPKTLKVPVGSTWSWTENPLGAMGYYLVSRGQKTPWRLAMRTPSFATLSVLPALLPGTRVDDLTTVLGSLFFVIGDADK